MAQDEARELLEQALEAGRSRDYRRSAELLAALIARYGGGPEASLYLGRAHYALGEQGRAIGAFRRFLDEGGDPATGLFFLGRSYLACDKPLEASRLLRRSVAVAPVRASGWAILGAAYLKLRRTKAALDCLERAVGLAPQDKRVYRGYLGALYARGVRLLARGEAELSSQMLGFAIDNGLGGPAPHLWRAKALRESGRPAEALADCEAALAASPRDPSIRWLRAGLLLATGRQPEALREFESLRAEHPELPPLPGDDQALARLRAGTAFGEGRYKQALSDSLALLRHEPKDAALRAIAAESLRSLGKPERARNHWLRAVEAAPNEGSFRLGLCLALFDLGDYEGALRAAERARKLGSPKAEVDYYSALCRSRLGEEPEQLIPLLQALLRERAASRTEAVDPRLMFALGEALYRSGRPDLASGWFEKVLGLAPDHELSLLYRISTAESLEDEAARLRAYGAYLEAYPDNQKLRREYVSALASRGDWAEAASQIELALPYGKPDAGTRRLFAAACRNCGRLRDAAIAYRDLLRESPGSGELLSGLVWCLYRDGKGEYALALLEKAPAAAKARAEPWILQATIYSRSGRDEDAVKALRSGLEAERGSERAWKALIALYEKRGLHEMAANCEEEKRKALAAAEAERSKRRAAGTAVGSATPAGSATGPARKPQQPKTMPSPAPAQPQPQPQPKLGLADLDIRSRRRQGG
jgi:tetratricopeptide (TPR) repeat protein